MQQSLRRFDPPNLYFDPQSGLHITIANYVGPLKVTNIPGKLLPANMPQLVTEPVVTR